MHIMLVGDAGTGVLGGGERWLHAAPAMHVARSGQRNVNISSSEVHAVRLRLQRLQRLGLLAKKSDNKGSSARP